MNEAAGSEDGDAPVLINTITEVQSTFATQYILTGAIKMVHDGVQKGVLWSEEALHHRHLVLYRRNAARSSLLLSILWFHSSENLEEKLSPLTIPQCSDAEFFPPVKTALKVSAGHFQAG